MTDRVPPERLAAWRGFITAHARAVDAIGREMEAAGVLPLLWYDVLIELREATGARLRLGELAAAVVLSRSGLTRLVDRLESAGLLRREPCETDKRGAYAALTDAGRAELRRAWPVYARGISNHFADLLEPEEVPILTGVFARVERALAPEPARDPEVGKRSPGEAS